jgi:glycosyltransferase involved in cell wall biosynthesis
MRIAYLIAGAGGMYCGSCLRDNRIVAELHRIGADVVAIPLYTPIRTDERVATTVPIHFGGVSLYLAHRWRPLRHLPRPVRRALDHPWLLRALSRHAVKTDASELVALTLSMLDGEAESMRAHRDDLFCTLRTARPDVVVLPNLLFAGLAAPLRRELDTTIVCTLSGEDVFLDALPEKARRQAYALIRDAVPHIHGFVAPTRYYGRKMTAELDLDPANVHYVPLGVDAAESLDGEINESPQFTIGFLARIAPEKGLDLLVDAFIEMNRSQRVCDLRVAGYLASESYLRDVRERVRQAGLVDHFQYAGELDLVEKTEFLRGLDCFCVPARHPEPKGLYVLEALLEGIPAVLPNHGSFCELIEETRGGLLYDPAEPGALSRSLSCLMDDPDLRASLGKAGSVAAETAYSTSTMVASAQAAFARACAERQQEDNASHARP